jgi:GNAT superfamily N-acetyltransferase
MFNRPRIVVLTSSATHPLRQRVLRPGRPLSECVFDGDDRADTIHFGVESEGALVGIASLYLEPPPSGTRETSDSNFRLRGMATADEVRGRGFGKALVRACLDHVARLGGGLFWCNARTTAAGFYEALGLRIRGEPFDMANIGPHVRMVVEVPSGTSAL